MYYLKLVSALQLLSARRSDFYVPDKMKVLDFLVNEGPLSQPFGVAYIPQKYYLLELIWMSLEQLE
jgi:hypothetical protein